MLQRIQTVYLLLVVILMSVTAFSPLLVLTDADSNIYDMCSTGIQRIAEGASELIPTWGVLTMAGLSAVVALINIFLFKKRKLQVRLGMFTTFLILFFYVTLFVYFYVYGNKYGLSFETVGYGVVLPFIALILNFMAIHKIKADEKLVKSMDRIR